MLVITMYSYHRDIYIYIYIYIYTSFYVFHGNHFPWSAVCLHHPVGPTWPAPSYFRQSGLPRRRPRAGARAPEAPAFWLWLVDVAGWVILTLSAGWELWNKDTDQALPLSPCHPIQERNLSSGS